MNHGFETYSPRSGDLDSVLSKDVHLSRSGLIWKHFEIKDQLYSHAISQHQKRLELRNSYSSTYVNGPACQTRERIYCSLQGKFVGAMQCASWRYCIDQTLTRATASGLRVFPFALYFMVTLVKMPVTPTHPARNRVVSTNPSLSLIDVAWAMPSD